MIFISHSTDDASRVEGLVGALKELGAEVWFSDIPPGDSIAGEMSRALGRAESLLVAWSRPAAASPHVEAEIHSFHMRHPEAGSILFLRLDETPLPALFADRRAVHATGDAAHDARVVKEWADRRQGRRSAGAGEGTSTEAHRLHDFRRGPMVELHRMTDELVRAYATLLDKQAAALSKIQEANRLRLAADPGDRRVTIIRLEYLPTFDHVGSYSFWQTALYEACRHGPRMLAALLLAQPDDLFTAAARAHRAELLNHLRATKQDR
jgi:hypothetical protein